MSRRTDRRMNLRTDGRIERRTELRTYAWNRWAGEQMDRMTDGQQKGLSIDINR